MPPSVCVRSGCGSPRVPERTLCRIHDNERRRLWRIAHKEHYLTQRKGYRLARLEKELAYNRAWRDRNRERIAAYGKVQRLANPERRAQWAKAWYYANKESRPEEWKAIRRDRDIRRHVRKAGAIAVRVQSNECGVCYLPLASTRFPDLLSTTIGHEPPLARCRPGDTVVERPEHLACNRRKGTRTDAELASG